MAQGKDDFRGEDELDHAPLEAILHRLEGAAQGDRVHLGDLVEALGRDAFLPLLMVLSLLLLSPLSGIPLASSIFGIAIALISAQMLWPGRDHIWLPEKLTRRAVDGARARQALRRAYGIARWMDRRLYSRLTPLVGHRPGRTALSVCCLLAGTAMPFFEVVPFTSSFLGLSVLLMATGLLARDGLFAVFGLLILVCAPLVPVFIVSSVTDGAS